MGRRISRSSSQDMKKLLLVPTGGRFLRPADPFDEVYPGVLLGDASTALSTHLLKDIGVTHVLNAAHGKNDSFYGGYVNTGNSYYERAGIKFLGIPAQDTPSYYLRPYFQEAADFIASAIRSKGKVLVHCQCGISRSAALVVAYLILKKGLNVQEALTTIREQRSIFPNQGFLSQLCDLDYDMRRQGALTDYDPKILYFDLSKPVKDSLKSCTRYSDRFPKFSTTNYTPLSRPLTKSGYIITSASLLPERNTEERPRARSEERYIPSFRERSPSPLFRPLKSSSDTETSEQNNKNNDEKYVSSVPTPLSTYEILSPFVSGYRYSESISKSYPDPRYHRFTRSKTSYLPAPFESSRSYPYIITSLERPLSARSQVYVSSRPYETYTYVSPPQYQRSYTSYMSYGDSDSFWQPRRCSPISNRSLFPSSYVPSVLRSPALVMPSLLTRVRA